jgi:uncharacterized protein (TIGR02284 family)
MATTTGSEKDLVQLLNNLIELDYDAVEAYQSAIEKLSQPSDQAQLRQFMEDHRRHVTDLSQIVQGLGATPSASGDIKRVLTKGKVVIGQIKGDRGILEAMKSNEDDTNEAYERASAQQGLPEHVRATLEKNLADERRHRAWIEQRLAADQPAQATTARY